MARVPMKVWAYGVLAAAAVAMAPAAAQAATTEAELAAQAAIPDLPDGKRSYAQAAFSKIRRGSNLAGPDDVPPATYAPGRLGEQRDALVRQHYAHMSEVDVMADAALRAHDVGQAERAEALRRRDTQHFFLAMQALRRLLLHQQAEVGP